MHANPAHSYPQLLNARRCNLRMTYAVLAKRSGISVPTLMRTLAGQNPNPSFDSVLAIAEALGISVKFEPQKEVHQLLEEQARQQAQRLVGMVQGTSGLEAQAVDADAVTEMTNQTIHELLAGSPRRLWGD